MKKMFLIIGLLSVSLLGNAKSELPDSLLSIKKAYSYNIIDIDTAIAIVHTLRNRQQAPQWRLDMVEGDLNYNGRRFLKALSFYKKIVDSPVLADSTYLQLKLHKRLMDCYDALYDDDALAVQVFILRKKAKSYNNQAFLAMSYFTEGKRMHFHGQTEEGYRKCLKAVEMMKMTEYGRKHIELRTYYAELVKMYARDQRYDDALRMSLLQEAEARQLNDTDVPKAPERALRRVYGIRASLLARAGRMDEADKAYAQWKKYEAGNDIDDLDALSYLTIRHHSQEALEVIMKYRSFIELQGDTMSYRMLSILNKEALAHINIGEYEKASMHGNQIARIADSIQLNVSREAMNTTYELLREQQASSRKELIAILLAVSAGVLLVLVIIILYYSRIIRRRNKKLYKALTGLDAYRKTVIDSNIQTVKPKETPAGNGEGQPTDGSPGKEPVNDDDDELRQLFVELDKQVTRDKLFLKPNLNRDDLMRLIGVDKNRFGNIISRYTDASNVSVYINTKRVEYGAQLLTEHPEYTIASIATECGMSNTVTFNRIFKDVYGVTPSEYRSKMGKENKNNEDDS